MDLGTVILSLLTLITVILLYWQFREMQKTNLGSFLLSLHDSFFLNEDNKKIIKMVENKEKILKKNGGKLSEQELDNYLGVIELLYTYVKAGILKKDIVNHFFGYYLVKTYQNKEIRTYVENVRKDNPTVYEGIIYFNRNV